jgi:hypothetical protein
VLDTSNIAGPQEQPQLLAGMLTAEQLEAEMDWGPRTRARREADGMPVIKLGHTKLYPIDRVRTWLMSHAEKRNAAPRRPGRPRTNAA